jgi:transposase
MRMVVALDVHRKQITYKTLERETGEVKRGRIAPAARVDVRAWLARFAGCEAEFALEGTTGWRFVVEEIERAGHRAHLADPAETAAKRGRKRRAKTDRADCDLMLKLLLAAELPESWIPPAHILELRTRVRMRKTLIDQRTAWQQRLQAQLFHQGAPAGLRPRTRAGREVLARVELSAAGRELVSLALRMIDTIDSELEPIDGWLGSFACRQPGCRALIEQLYGVGPVSATAILAELGDCRRFARSTTQSVTAAWTSPSTNPTANAQPATSRTRVPSCCAGRCSRPPNRPPGAPPPTTPTTIGRSPTGSTTTAPASRSRASSAGAPTTSCASSATTRSPPSTPMRSPTR